MRWDDPRQNADHWVYIAWRGDDCLYVGMTSDYHQRLTSWEKAGRSGWWHDATHIDVWAVGPGRDHAYDLERDTIRALDPVHNRQHSPRVEAEKALWAEFYEWARAYQDGYGQEDWAFDQATADARCALIGRRAPDVAARRAEVRAQLRAIVNAIGPVRPEAGAA